MNAEHLAKAAERKARYAQRRATRRAAEQARRAKHAEDQQARKARYAQEREQHRQAALERKEAFAAKAAARNQEGEERKAQYALERDRRRQDGRERKEALAAREAVRRQKAEERKARYGRPLPQVADKAVEVVHYPSVSDFERDATRRMAAGWELAGQSLAPGRSRRLKKAVDRGAVGALLGFPMIGVASGLLTKQRDPESVTATWVRRPSPGP